jgi:hypothetical protein
MKNYTVFILFFILLFNCSPDDSSDSSFVNDFTIEMDENPTENQYIGRVPSEGLNGTIEFLTVSILNQTVQNAIYIEYPDSLGSNSLYVNNPVLFDFETNPVIKVTVRVNKVRLHLDFVTYDILETKTITVTINLNDLPD